MPRLPGLSRHDRDCAKSQARLSGKARITLVLTGNAINGLRVRTRNGHARTHSFATLFELAELYLRAVFSQLPAHLPSTLAGLPGHLVQRLRAAGLDGQFTLAHSTAEAAAMFPLRHSQPPGWPLAP
jgi:hypothetical protein